MLGYDYGGREALQYNTLDIQEICLPNQCRTTIDRSIDDTLNKTRVPKNASRGKGEPRKGQCDIVRVMQWKSRVYECVEYNLL